MVETGRVTLPRAAPRLVQPVTALRIAIIVSLLAAWEALAASGLLYRDVVPSLLAIGKALSPAMKLDRLELVGSGGKPGAGESNLAITGVLPEGEANLKLVAGFIDRLSRDQSFSRRFGQVRFTGVGEGSGAGGTQNAAAAAAALRRETLFHVVGLGGGRK